MRLRPHGFVRTRRGGHRPNRKSPRSFATVKCRGRIMARGFLNVANPRCCADRAFVAVRDDLVKPKECPPCDSIGSSAKRPTDPFRVETLESTHVAGGRRGQRGPDSGQERVRDAKSTHDRTKRPSTAASSGQANLDNPRGHGSRSRDRVALRRSSFADCP